MKKKFIIYSSTLLIAFFLNYSAQAQQQKKPSERSFKTEIEKINQKRSERNEMIRKTQQPSSNSPVVDDKNITGDSKVQTSNTGTSIQKTQTNPVSKPSTGKMKQPPKRYNQ